MSEEKSYWEIRASNLYHAYGSVTDWLNYAGLPMPAWDDLSDKIKAAWQAAAKRGQMDSANYLIGQTIV